MLNSQWLDIAIGVVLVWFLFALAVSALNEGLVKLLALRPKQLWSALGQMLDASEDPQGLLRNLLHLPARQRPASPYPPPNAPVAARLYATQTLQALEVRSKVTQRTAIDNIPASVFSQALIELALGIVGNDGGAGTDAISRIESYVAGLPQGRLKAQLQSILAAAGQDIAQFRAGVERWFEGQMTRLSRLYRAQVHIVLLFIGMVVAVVGFGFGLQSNALQLVSAFQHDQNLRTVVVAAATDAARGDLAKAGNCNLATDPNPAACQLRGVSSLDKIDFVLHGDAPPPRASLGERLGYLVPWRHPFSALGVVITGVAISFGASFWFALLQRLIGMRSGGSTPAA